MANTNTKVFSLENKSLKLDTSADLEPLIAPLRDMDNVEEVKLFGNTLGVGACKLLGEVLSTKKALKIADLSDIFTGRLIDEIPDALSSLLTSILNLPNLTTINLSDNAFGLRTQEPLVAFLSSHVPLQHLILNNNGLGPHAGILVADALSELHAKKQAARERGESVPDLATVICGRNRLENGSMTAWARAYHLHDKVHTIRMVQNGIQADGIGHLVSEGFRHLRGLRVLDMQDNMFCSKGAKELVKLISSWPELQDLGISDTLFSARSSSKLFESLAKGENKKLETLRLQYSDVNSNGLKQLVAAAVALPALRKLELNGNKFSESDASITALRELLDGRKEKLGGDVIDEDSWGLDGLNELDSDEDEDEDEDEEEESEGEDSKVHERADKLLKEAEEAQEEPTVQVRDGSVDALASKLDKTTI